MKNVFAVILFALFLSSATVCRADSPIVPHAPGHPGDDRPKLPDYLPEKPQKGLDIPSPPAKPPETAPGDISFQLNGLIFEGNTVFTDEELQSAVQPFIGKRVILADLEEIRYRLTRYYVDKGYINSGALLKPDQSVDDGTVTYLIIEGRLNAVNVTGNGRLRPGYIQKRIWPDADQPFDTGKLQERFQLLLQDPLIDRMNGKIRPGLSPGEALLDVDVTRAKPYDLRFIADNHRSPSTGAERITAAGTLWNLTGFGDVLDASLGISEGADAFSAGYSIPITARNTRLSLRYDYSENAIIEEPLASADIESRSESGEIHITHPVFQTLRRSLELGVTLAVRESKTWIFKNRPFSFTSGDDDDGESRVTALRLIQAFTDRTPNTALSLRSTFSVGMDLFDATVHDHNETGRPDGKYMTWIGQIQYARRLGDRFGQMILRGDVQIAEDRLLSLEQFAVGGVDTVRGYRENELVRDNGYVLSAEWRYPLWPDPGNNAENTLTFSLFTDFGTAWNKGESTHEDKLHSVGAGLAWAPGSWFSAELFAAHDLDRADAKDDHDWQDEGIHFRCMLKAF